MCSVTWLDEREGHKNSNDVIQAVAPTIIFFNFCPFTMSKAASSKESPYLLLFATCRIFDHYKEQQQFLKCMLMVCFLKLGWETKSDP